MCFQQYSLYRKCSLYRLYVSATHTQPSPSRSLSPFLPLCLPSFPSISLFSLSFSLSSPLPPSPSLFPSQYATAHHL